MLCVREGVKGKRSTWERKRFGGFKNTGDEEEFRKNLEMVLELGRRSLGREVRGVGSLEGVRGLCERVSEGDGKREWNGFEGFGELFLDRGV